MWLSRIHLICNRIRAYCHPGALQCRLHETCENSELPLWRLEKDTGVKILAYSSKSRSQKDASLYLSQQTELTQSNTPANTNILG